MSTREKKKVAPLPDAYTTALRKKQESREFLARLTEKAEAARMIVIDDPIKATVASEKARKLYAQFVRSILLTSFKREALARGAPLAGFLPVSQ